MHVLYVCMYVCICMYGELKISIIIAMYVCIYMYQSCEVQSVISPSTTAPLDEPGIYDVCIYLCMYECHNTSHTNVCMYVCM